jgi:hypothetical protein
MLPPITAELPAKEASTSPRVLPIITYVYIYIYTYIYLYKCMYDIQTYQYVNAHISPSIAIQMCGNISTFSYKHIFILIFK